MDGYEILETLGKGGMGVVYRARDAHLGREVAIKRLVGDFLEERLLKRFQREADAVAQLNHPNIVGIHSVGSHQGKPHLVMDLVVGESLSDRIKRGPLAGKEAARITELVARALHHAHEKQILHRDVKPDNVLLRADDGQPLLTDFGLAKNLTDEKERLTISGQMLGTPSFMSPEQASGELSEMSPATDVYGLGATLFALLTGEPPFTGKTPYNVVKQVITAAPTPPSDIRPEVPAELEAICLRCLAKEPVDRYPSAADLAEDLGRFLRGESVEAQPLPSGRGKLALLGLVLSAAASVPLALYALQSKPPAPGTQSGPTALTRTPATAPAESLAQRSRARHRGCAAAIPYGDELLLTAGGDTLRAWTVTERRSSELWSRSFPDAELLNLAAHPTRPILFVACRRNGEPRLLALDPQQPSAAPRFDVVLPGPVDARPLLLVREERIVVAHGQRLLLLDGQGKAVAQERQSLTVRCLASDGETLAVGWGGEVAGGVSLLDPNSLQTRRERTVPARPTGLAPRARGGWWIASASGLVPHDAELGAGEPLIDGPVDQLVALPKGRLAVVAPGDDGPVLRLVDANRRLSPPTPLRSPATEVTSSATGHSLALLGEQGAELWGVPGPPQPKRSKALRLTSLNFLRHGGCLDVAFLDDERVVTAGTHGSMIWDLSGTRPRALPFRSSPGRQAVKVAVVPRRSLLVTATLLQDEFHPQLEFHDLEMLRAIRDPLPLQRGSFGGLVTLGDDRLGMAWGRTLAVLDTETFDLDAVEVPQDAARSYEGEEFYRLATDRAGKRLLGLWRRLSVPGEKGLIVERALGDDVLRYHRISQSDVNAIAESPDGRWWVGFHDQRVEVYGPELADGTGHKPNSPFGLRTHTGPLRSLHALDDGRAVSVSGSDQGLDESIILWRADMSAQDSAKPPPPEGLSRQEQRFDDAAISPDERRMLITNKWSGAELWALPAADVR